MSFYGGNQNGAQPGSAQQQQMGRQPANPGLGNVQQVLTPQLFNINVNPNQLHNFFNEHNSSQNQLQLNAAAGNPPSILLQTQQPQSFPVNIINDQLGVGVGQLITPASVPQGQMQGLPISMSSALNFQQTIHQVHAQTAPSQQSQAQSQQSKQQRVFTGTVTKVHDNFGFIDEEVFFQMGAVKGPILPKEGDRVLVEADFNASMPFKWNATRVQIVNIGGGMSSSLNNMSNMNSNQHSQQQHNMAFNTSMGMAKQSAAPPPQVHTSQTNPARPHAGQPVSIVSNPHSVYSGGSNNPRGRAQVGTVPPPVAPLVPQREPPKRPMPLNLPSAPEPPSFINNPVSGLIAERERELERERERSREAARERSRERSRERQRERERSRERARARSRERSRERARNNRSREREKLPARPRSRSRDRDRARDRSRDRSSLRPLSRERSRERTLGRERSLDRGGSGLPSRLRSRSRSRDRNARDRSPDRRDRVKRDLSPEKPKDRVRAKDRDHRKKTPTPPRGSKDEPKRDSKTREKEKDRSSNDKSKPRDRSPQNSTTQSTDRSRRSRSRESVRTDKGHEVKSRSRSGSPRRKALARPPPRYAVEIPKFSFDMKDINAKEIHRRYPNLYVPSDFFLAKSTWMDTFPLHTPFELGHSCPVQIMRKGIHKIEISDVEGLSERFKEIPDVLEPPDASFIFKAKVMIPSMNSLEAMFKKALGENSTDGSDSPQHIDRLINFIVGMKTSKHEVMALGGPWSPSLDGANPHSDPQTLINTAIRCSRALAGINLSRCKNWYRFMELYYKRSNCLETVVFFLPDVWTCLPNTVQWSKLKSLHKYAVKGEKADLHEKETSTSAASASKDPASGSGVVNGDSAPNGGGCGGEAGSEAATSSNESSQQIPKTENSNVPGTLETPVGGGGERDSLSQSNSNSQDEANTEEDDLNSSGLLVIDEAESPSRDDAPGTGQSGAGKAAAASSSTSVEGETMEDSQNCGEAPSLESMEKEGDQKIGSNTNSQNQNGVPENGDQEQPPHLKAINPKMMNVAQLREQLNLRNLNSKGLKAQLITRLTEALAVEEKEREVVTITTTTIEEVKEENLPVPEPMDTTTSQVQGDAIVVGNTEGEIKLELGASSEDPKKEMKEEEQVIRLVNPSLIFEAQDDDEDDSASIEDGELKEDPNAMSQTEREFEQILGKFPPNTFPIIKEGMKEEDVKMWERRYLLPRNPRLLMYPSSVAKGGHFDCISMSLGLLRDYRIIDKKEDSFEVSLFSEFFHEMLQRDFAFRIYREIVNEAGKPSEEVATSASEKENEKDEKPADPSSTGGEPATKRRKLSTASSITTVSSTLKKTTDPYLHLAFIFFDITRCGYITETDLEDLCCSIGIGLTRAQVRKVVSKVVHKGTLYYKKWTERQEKAKVKSEEEIRLLAQGNMAHFPVFVLENVGGILGGLKGPSSADESESVIVSVGGRDVDVKKLVDQVEKYEKDLAVAESSLNVMKNSLNEAKSQVTDLKKSNESQKEELSKVKDLLKKSESSEKSSKESLEIFKRSTERFIDRVKDFVKLPTTPSKEKSESGGKDSGSGSSGKKDKSKGQGQDPNSNNTSTSTQENQQNPSDSKESKDDSGKGDGGGENN